LIQGGVKAASQPALSVADVQALQDDPSPASRAVLAGKFGRQYDQLVEGDARALAQAVLELFARDADKMVRQALAEAAAASARMPQAIARRLANDDLEVARPILTYSPALTDDDLVEIVRARAKEHALAVAGRERLSEPLADVLTDTDSPDVVAVLTGNPGAELSVATLRRIADAYREDRAVQDRLIRRPALPRELLEQLLMTLGERLEWELLRQRRIDKSEARQLMAAARERAALSSTAREREERAIERELRHRISAGDLGPEDILRFLRDGEIARLEAGLALLAGLDLRRVRDLLYGMNKRAFAALCARAGFGAPHYVALRMALDLAEQALDGADPESTYAADTIFDVQEQFDQIRSDRAQMATWLGG
jgi:uncharacterized protein (DUF2336 family)